MHSFGKVSMRRLILLIAHCGVWVSCPHRVICLCFMSRIQQSYGKQLTCPWCAPHKLATALKASWKAGSLSEVAWSALLFGWRA